MHCIIIIARLRWISQARDICKGNGSNEIAPLTCVFFDLQQVNNSFGAGDNLCFTTIRLTVLFFQTSSRGNMGHMEQQSVHKLHALESQQMRIIPLLYDEYYVLDISLI